MASQGNFFSSTSQNHQFLTNDPVFLEFGSGSFTKKSIKNVLKGMKVEADNISDEEFYQDHLEGVEDDSLTIDIINDANSGSWVGKAFVNANNSYSDVTYTFQEVIDLIDTFEEKIKDLTKKHEDKDTAVQKRTDAKNWISANIDTFKTGEQECLQLHGTLFYNKDLDDSGSEKEYWTKIFFYMPKERNNERVVATKGKTVISDVGTRATGAKYSTSKTKSALSRHHPGLYINADAIDASSLDDLASGPLRLSYNNSLGMWESSQCILARLITDLAPAGNNPFTMPDETNGYLSDPDEAAAFYNKGSELYTGNFTTGLAVPVNAENKNPHLFGPNFNMDEYGEKSIERIMVVNRAEKEFTAGTLVMCTLIGAEWIVSEFSTAGQGFPTRMGAWTFSKFIANSDNYFRSNDETDRMWDINTYEDRARRRWYEDWKTSVADGSESHLGFHNIATIATDNGAENVPFNPSCGYQMCTSFDTAKYHKDTKINFDEIMSDTQGDPQGNDLPIFWGPVLPDGYNSKAPTIGEAGASFGINSDKYFYSTDYLDEMNIPADMAVNGPYSEDYNTSPILPLDYWQEKLFGGGSLYSNAKSYRNEIFASQTYKNGFGFQPKNPNRLQFAPLTMEMVINTDEDQADESNPNYDNGFTGGGKVAMYNNWREAYGNENMFGFMFDRYSCVAKQAKQIQYDKKVEFKPLSTPYNYWYTLFRDQENEQTQGLNLTAVTAAINRISRPGGGEVNIEVAQQFGTTPARTVSGGQNASFNGVAAFFGIVSMTPATPPSSNTFTQWGSVTDKYNTAGTTALHCRAFDAWPRRDTIWDTRFFSALHFNPDLEDEDGRTDVDFQVPTLLEGGFPSDGASITAADEASYKNKKDWTYDKIRRGKLLTNGGFKYNKLTIGLDPSSLVIAKAGESAVSGFVENDRNEYKFYVNVTDGAVQSVDFNTSDSLGVPLEGIDLSPNAFSGAYVDDAGTIHNGFIVRYADSVLIFQGKVRLVKRQDNGPVEHGGVVRCTASSNYGQGQVSGTTSASLALDPNNTGKYDVYFFFHNDISHTYQSADYNPFMSNGLQYVVANIT